MFMNAQIAVTPAEPSRTEPAEEALAALFAGRSLSQDESETLFAELVAGRLSEPSIAALLIALKIKGETADELIGAARALRAADAPFERPDYLFADSCGTGGDGSGTINLSTAVAFVAAASGLPVAKHGNRSVTSRCGSADVLEQLGDQSRRAGRSLAPRPRRDRPLLPVRAQLSSRPQACRAGAARAQGPHVMNVLGPCVNPAEPPVQLLGVADPRLLEPVAQVLAALGVEQAMVVHGAGLDEVALHGETQALRRRARPVRAARLHARGGRARAGAADRPPGRRPRGECRAAEGAADGPRHRRRAARGRDQRRRPAADRGQGGDAAGRGRTSPSRRSARAPAIASSRPSSRSAMADPERRARRDRAAQAHRRRRAARRREPGRARRARRDRPPAKPRRRARPAGDPLHHGSEEAVAFLRRDRGGGRARRPGGAPMPAPRTRSASSPTAPSSAARSRISARCGASSTARSSPRTSSSTRARCPRRGSTAPTPCSSSCRCSTMPRRPRSWRSPGGSAWTRWSRRMTRARCERAVALGAPILGINNRDLRTLDDRSRRDRAARAAGSARSPARFGIGHRRAAPTSIGWRRLPTRC